MHDESSLIRSRIERLLRQRIQPARYRERRPVKITCWEAPGEPVPFTQAVNQDYQDTAVGDTWGKAWGTTWFHIQGDIPDVWSKIPGTSVELIADIGFNTTQTGFQCEAIAYDATGHILKAVEPHNRYVRLPTEGAVDIFLEAASNPDVINKWTFVPTPFGRKETAGNEPLYRLEDIALGLRDHDVCLLFDDLTVLTGIVDVLPISSTRRARIIAAFEQCLITVDPADICGTALAGRETLAEVMAQPAVPSAHRVIAVGHAHIDSAWLWPLRETRRKVARTFSNVLDLIEQDNEFVFAATSAQQFQWIKEDYPELYCRVKHAVSTRRIIPVGSMWIEPDANLTGGESLVRQFVHGTRFFSREFGIEQQEVWLPDSFGYTASLPQLMRLAGARWFLTQKISWNQVNRMPHHTFWWEGIDGSRVFTHFPPADTYGSDLSAKELQRAEDQYAEKAVGTLSLVPFGYGDGGGGPTREMLATAHRKKSLEGSPRVDLGSPQEFFAQAQQEYPDPPVWSGELYLEMHRGSFTTQARTKQGNRRSEALLRQAELWSATATIRTGAPYPYQQLEDIWHDVLLHQFHDILPGTCIGWVHDEVEARYVQIHRELEQIIKDAIGQLAGAGDTTVFFNAAPYSIDGVAPMAAGLKVRNRDASTVKVETLPDGAIEVDTGTLRIHVGTLGTIESLIDIETGREAIPTGMGANELQLFRDTPAQWDAWDIDIIDRATKVVLGGPADVRVAQQDSDSVTIHVSRDFGHSHVDQSIEMVAGQKTVKIVTDIDWHEKEKMLKLAFPFDVRAEYSTSEIQFGHLKRPLHTNTSWDIARFETPAQKWVHVGEPDYGFSVANDSVYGHDFSRASTENGSTVTTVRLSLLRSPLYPDPQADQGKHRFTVMLRADADISQAIEDGYQLALPLVETASAVETVKPLVSVDGRGVVVEAVKLAEDGSGDVVVRLYEGLGNRERVSLDTNFAFQEVYETDLHENRIDDQALVERFDDSVELLLRPFQIVTVRFSRKDAS